MGNPLTIDEDGFRYLSADCTLIFHVLQYIGGKPHGFDEAPASVVNIVRPEPNGRIVEEHFVSR